MVPIAPTIVGIRLPPRSPYPAMSSDLDPVFFKKVWERGVGLEPAAQRFAHPELKAKYEAAKAVDVWPNLDASLVSPEDWTGALKTISAVVTERSNTWTALQRNLLRLISLGHVNAYPAS